MKYTLHFLNWYACWTFEKPLRWCRKGKRSALVDHQAKNREHKQLVEAMESSIKRVMLVAGVAQRLAGKVAIVTGWSSLSSINLAFPANSSRSNALPCFLSLFFSPATLIWIFFKLPTLATIFEIEFPLLLQFLSKRRIPL